MDTIIVLARLEDAMSLIMSLLPGKNILGDSNLGRVYGQVAGMAADLKRGRLVREEIACALHYAGAILNNAFLYYDRQDKRSAILAVETYYERDLLALFYAR